MEVTPWFKKFHWAENTQAMWKDANHLSALRKRRPDSNWQKIYNNGAEPQRSWNQDCPLSKWWKGKKSGEKKKSSPDINHVNSMVKHSEGGVMTWGAPGTGSLDFIDDVTSNGSSRMNSPEISRLILFANLPRNASSIIGSNFTKHTANTTELHQGGKKRFLTS